MSHCSLAVCFTLLLWSYGIPSSLFPHLWTICSLAPMTCYFSELSALLAYLFKGTKYGLDRSQADLDWLAGELGALGGLGRGETERQSRLCCLAFARKQTIGD